MLAFGEFGTDFSVIICVYVIRSLENGKRYVGIAANVGSRLREHARRATKGGQQLGRFELLHREAFESYAEARVREKFLKSGQGREWLDAKFGSLAEQSKVDLRSEEPSVRR